MTSEINNQKESPQFSKTEPIFCLVQRLGKRLANASDEQGPADHQQHNCYDVWD